MEKSQMVIDGSDDPLIIGLPPGFRFRPTDEEIVTHYLTPKVLDRSFNSVAIGEADLNKSEPWDLPKKAKMGEKEWFFFYQRDRKYPTGTRTNRATESGYWKATGKDKEIFKAARELVGMKKTLVFYKGRAPRGEKTNWVMHEFRLEGKFSYYTMPTSSTHEDEWVVCRVFHKSMGTQKSPTYNHGLNSIVEELLSNPPNLPPLLDQSGPTFDPSFTSGHPYFSRDQHETLPKDYYENILVSSNSYNFDTNMYQASSLMSELQYTGKNPQYLTSESTLHLSNHGLKTEKNNTFDEQKAEYLIQTLNQVRKINTSNEIKVSNDMTNIESSSTSMLSDYDLGTKDYNDDDVDDDPSTFLELELLLQY